MCDIVDAFVESGKREGILEGKQKGKVEAYLDVGLPKEEIAKKLGISLEEVECIIASLEN